MAVNRCDVFRFALTIFGAIVSASVATAAPIGASIGPGPSTTSTFNRGAPAGSSTTAVFRLRSARRKFSTIRQPAPGTKCWPAAAAAIFRRPTRICRSASPSL